MPAYRAVFLALAMPTLVLAGCQTAPAAPPPSGPILSGTNWQLSEIRPGNAGDAVRRPADPTRYTLSFGADGQVAARFDCNRGGGRWTSVGGTGPAGALDLGPLVSTKMFCGPESLGDAYGLGLSTISSYMLKGDELVLGPTPDGGLLVFAPGAASP
ncbi:META domain-containing protein [Zavarzinia sp. CC-PAN008]|uniref:META domain-containing protein n=1 Tax=Zavarzinia sp. CC-PAN008 TaxID=3243332 RepID=UPI003F745897